MILAVNAYSQDPVYTQFYSAPVILNPAFAGSTGDTRLSFGYRDQWRELSSDLSTIYASADSWFEGINSGIGLTVVHQSEELGEYSQSTIELSYAYHLRLSENLTFFPGFGIGYGMRNMNFNGLLFEDQIDIGTGNTYPDSSDPLINDLRDNPVNYPDISAGGVLYAENFWIGIGIRHLNKPDISFVEKGEVLLEPLTSIHGGYRFSLSKGYTYLDPGNSFLFTTFNYITQNEYNRIDLGAELALNKFTLGLLASGSVQKYEGESSSLLSLNPFIGFQTDKLKLGFSYDFPVSEIGNTGSTAEITLQYYIQKQYERKRRWQIKN
jgi:type IX secretion system PorP/SprF family membrane protein